MLIPAQVVRAREVLSHSCLDGWLIWALTHSLSTESTQSVLDTLVKLGLVVNFKKSDLVPSRDLVFLGARFDTRAGLVSLSPGRVTKVRETTLRLLSCRHVAPRSILKKNSS